jgi:hypothetical protein
MRPIPARILLSLVSVFAGALAVRFQQPILFVVALGSVVLLATSLATQRLPLPRALARFRNHAVRVCLWGDEPPGSADTTLILSSVNVLGAGTHVFFLSSGGTSMHLKIAQPRGSAFAPERVTVTAARYVQWNSTKLKRNENRAAVLVTLIGSPEEQPRNSVA